MQEHTRAHTPVFVLRTSFERRIQKASRRPTSTFQAFCPRRCRIQDAKCKSCMSMLSARRYQAELGSWWLRAYSFCLCVGCFFSCGWIWFYFPVRLESSFIFFTMPVENEPTCLPPKRQNASECAVFLFETNLL